MPDANDVGKFKAALEMALHTIGTSQVFGEFKLGSFIDLARTIAGLPNDNRAQAYFVASEEFLWTRVRCGLVRPVNIESGGEGRAGQSVWVFTGDGLLWRSGNPMPMIPGSDKYVPSLLDRFPFLAKEPINLIDEARRAWLAGLPRAPMFLVGLLNEDLLIMIFESGLKQGGVTDTNTSKNAGRAWAIQRDVFIGLSKRESSGAIPKGTTNEWDSLVSTLREYRNKCAHESAYIPPQEELAFAFLSLPRLAELVKVALSAFS